MTDSPRVLSIVWSLIRGGTEGQCARLAMLLGRRGISHRVAVFRREGYFLDEVERACGPVYHLDILHMISVTTARHIHRLVRYIREDKIELIHAWDCDAAIFGAVAARMAGVPLITSHRDLGEIYSVRKLWLMKKADEQACAVVVNANAIETFVRRSGIPPEKIVRLTNTLDVEEFDRLASEPLPAGLTLPTGPLVAMVARLDPEKDVETFLIAAERVRVQRPDAHFVIAGNGPERHALEEMARGRQLLDCVHFLGDITCIPALLQRCVVGVLVPRANEGLSNTVLEYMAAGLPVVATDCGGNRELIRHEEGGFIVPPRDSIGVAGHLLALLADPEKARTMGRCGREKILRDHQPNQVAQTYLDLYHRVTS